MKRPAFQFYPEAWLGNQKLRRCSKAARGAWIDTLCVLHDSDEYGIVRYPLRELASVVGATVKLMREIVDKGVLKGSDGHCPAFIFVPRHAGKDGEPVTLIHENDGPCWYSSRMVRDEYVREHAGASTRFKPASATSQPPPTHRHGDEPTQRQGDGSLSLTLSLERSTSNPIVKLESPTSPGANGADAHPGTEKPPSRQEQNRSQWSSPAWVAATAQTLGVQRRSGEREADFADRVHAAVDAKRRDDRAEAKRRAGPS